MFEIGTRTKYHHIIHTSNTTWFNIIQTMWICFELRQNWIPSPWPYSLDTLFSATKRLSIISFTINHWSSLNHLSCYFTSYRWSCWLTDWLTDDSNTDLRWNVGWYWNLFRLQDFRWSWRFIHGLDWCLLDIWFHLDHLTVICWSIQQSKKFMFFPKSKSPPINNC